MAAGQYAGTGVKVVQMQDDLGSSGRRAGSRAAARPARHGRGGGHPPLCAPAGARGGAASCRRRGRRARRRRTLLAYLTVAVVAAAAGAGLTGYALSANQSPSSASGAPSGGSGSDPGALPGIGFPSGNSRHGISSSTEHAVVSVVPPGLVDISSNLGYQGSQAAATGMIISANGLV